MTTATFVAAEPAAPPVRARLAGTEWFDLHDANEATDAQDPDSRTPDMVSWILRVRGAV